MADRPLLLNDAPQPPAERGALLRGVLAAGMVFLGTRLVVAVAAYAGATVCFRIEFKIEPTIEHRVKHVSAELKNPDSAMARRHRELLLDFAPFLHWDAGHYRSIVEKGYTYGPPRPGETREQRQHNIAFFPLYPMLCTMFAPMAGAAAAMILVSHLAGTAAAMLLYLWARGRAGHSGAMFAVAAAFCWPPACFYSFGYAESVTVALVVATFLLLDRRQHATAALACGAATAARPTALVLAVVVALTFLIRQRDGLPRKLLLTAGIGLLSISGAALYAGYLTWKFGSPLVYLANYRDGWVSDEMRADWVRFVTLAPLWEPLRLFGRVVRDFPGGVTNLSSPMLWNIPCGLFILFLCIGGFRRVPASFRPYLLLGPLILLDVYVSSGGNAVNMSATARYTMLTVPAFVVLGAWAIREWTATARIVFVSAIVLLQASWAFHFGLHEWCG